MRHRMAGTWVLDVVSMMLRSGRVVRVCGVRTVFAAKAVQQVK